MKIIDAAQGSQQWLDARAKHFTASEAPAMLGLSKYKTRQALLREKATGLTEEVDAGKQRLFNRGHEAEAVARPLAEIIIGEDLFPATGSSVVDGLPLLASFDGLSMDEAIVWECKLASIDVETMIDVGELTGTYWPQVEQQLLVSGAKRALFTACDGEQITAHLWYESRPERRAAIIAGWKQFSEDLAMYQHVEPAPVATAAPINELPALMVEITGAVTASNLYEWRGLVTERIAGINTDLQTDQDFADADQMVKFLDDGEKRIDLVKSQAQAQASDIDMVFRALDEIKASMRSKRLELDKLVKARKESIRGEIAREGLSKLNDHVDTLNKRLGRKFIQPAGDFHTAIKGKRTVQSLRDACDSELARSKIIASEQADRIQINLNAYADLAPGHDFLFSDLDALVMKDADGFAAIVTQRIDNHAKAEAKRLDQERERIAAHERAKIENEQRQAAVRAIEKEMPLMAIEPAAQPAATITTAEIGGYSVAPAVAAAPAHMGITGSAKILDEIDDILRGFTLADLIKVRDFAAQIAGQREKVAA